MTERALQDLWFTEIHPEHRGLTFRVREVLASRSSEYQHIQVLETEDAGKMLVIDGTVMLSTRDEFVYHEMLAHVPMFSHPEPRRVLIVGGGDGGTAREVLRHDSVEVVDLVDIDPAVFDVCREHLPETSSSFDDPRLRLIAADGARFVEEAGDPYDVVLVDSTDPVGPGIVLFQTPFYRAVERALAPGGLVACQSESPFLDPGIIRDMHLALREVFGVVHLYLAPVPVYPSGQWTFTVAGRTGEAQPDAPRREAPASWGLRWYDPGIHRASFALPPFVAGIVAP